MSRHRHRTSPRALASNAPAGRSRPGSYESSPKRADNSFPRFDAIQSLCVAIAVGLMGTDVALGQQLSSTPNPDRQGVVDLVTALPTEADDRGKLWGNARAIDRRPRLFRAKLVSNLILVPNIEDESYQDAPRETALVAPAPGATTEVDNRDAAPDRLRAIPDAHVSVHFEHLASATQASETSRQWLDVRPRTLHEPSTIVPAADLPPDTSQLPAAPRIPELIQLYAANLHCADFCASATFCHQPLYFEDRLLERHGVSHGIFRCLPPVQSGFHFLGRTAMLPAAVLHDRPCSCVRNECICR
jgi:hypothetical protein